LAGGIFKKKFSASSTIRYFFTGKLLRREQRNETNKQKCRGRHRGFMGCFRSHRYCLRRHDGRAVIQEAASFEFCQSGCAGSQAFGRLFADFEQYLFGFSVHRKNEKSNDGVANATRYLFGQ
jgi:hypothetical protein